MCGALALLSLNFLQYVPIFWRTAMGGAVLPIGYLRFSSLFHLLLELVLGLASILMIDERGKLALELHNRELRLDRDRWAGLAQTDSLTGLLNRHALQALIESGSADLGSGSGSVAIVDLDALKEINDRLGHTAGDAVLCATAAALRGSVRPGDALFRWGGDEFLVIAPGLEEGLLAARLAPLRSFRSGLANADLSRPPWIRTSAGCAAFASMSEIPAAVELADVRMYREKASLARTGDGASSAAIAGALAMHAAPTAAERGPRLRPRR